MIDPYDIYSPVRTLLRARLLALPGLADLAPGAIHWEGQTYEPIIGKGYIRENMKKVSGRRINPGPISIVRYFPLYLLDCFSPKVEGCEGSDKMGDTVTAHFWPGLQLVDVPNNLVVTIVNSGPLPTQPETNWRMEPITIALKFDTLTPQ